MARKNELIEVLKLIGQDVKEISQRLQHYENQGGASDSEIAEMREKLTACEQNITALQAYIGFDDNAALSAFLQRITQQGA